MMEVASSQYVIEFRLSDRQSLIGKLYNGVRAGQVLGPLNELLQNQFNVQFNVNIDNLSARILWKV